MSSPPQPPPPPPFFVPSPTTAPAASATAAGFFPPSALPSSSQTPRVATSSSSSSSAVADEDPYAATTPRVPRRISATTNPSPSTRFDPGSLFGRRPPKVFQSSVADLDPQLLRGLAVGGGGGSGQLSFNNAVPQQQQQSRSSPLTATGTTTTTPGTTTTGTTRADTMPSATTSGLRGRSASPPPLIAVGSISVQTSDGPGSAVPLVGSATTPAAGANAGLNLYPAPDSPTLLPSSSATGGNRNGDYDEVNDDDEGDEYDAKLIPALGSGGSDGSDEKWRAALMASFKRNFARNLALLVVGVLCVILTAVAWSSSSSSSSPSTDATLPVANDPIAAAPTPNPVPSPLPPPPPRPSPPPTRPPNVKPVLMDDIFTGTLYATKSSVQWLPSSAAPAADDGDFVQYDASKSRIVVRNAADISKIKAVLVDGTRARLGDGRTVPLSEDYLVSADRSLVLVATKREKHWRHSSTAEYVVVDVAAQTAAPLTTSGRNGATGGVQVARFAPTGNNVAFVRDNDVYVRIASSGSTQQPGGPATAARELRITFDGSAAVMSGVPDWVYEEEVLASSHALYWSPTGAHLAYLRFNDTGVPVYSYPYYFDPASRRDAPYPAHVPIRYPKPGFSNPTVSMHLLNVAATASGRLAQPSKSKPVPAVPWPTDLNLGDPVPLNPGSAPSSSADQLVVVDVAWVADTLLAKVMNRIQSVQVVVAIGTSADPVTSASTAATVVRRESVKGGWIEISHQVTPVSLAGKSDAAAPPSKSEGYLDLVDVDGYLHLVLFTSARATTPIVLTRGPWEVAGIKGVDPAAGVAYILTSQDSASTRTLARVRLDGEDVDAPRSGAPPAVGGRWPQGFYGVTMSPRATYAWTTYDGPGVPWQAFRKPTDPKWEVVVQDNAALQAAVKGYALPRAEYRTIPVPADPANESVGAETVDLDAVMFYPPEFDPTKKYPVLMRVYGGPNSQLVQQKFDVDLHTYLASNKSIIGVVVDGRGTGSRGRAFRHAVHRNLGFYEAADQENAGRWLAAQSWVDASKIAIWGWSYGGYVTAKVVERNTRGTFAAAIAVAPVTDWRFYDSVYTERYMSTPADNPDGYRDSSVANMPGFKKTRFLLVHGTGDDNVHVGQSLALVRKMQLASVRAYRVQVFPDSDHSMNFGNAYRELYAMMDRFLGHVFFGTDEYEVLARRDLPSLRIEVI
ncbi:dipeptidyl peptidase IV N-terminal region-domain-containing protein [Blastocladiella britannica]|nr:dipeptidyl peptidase IV N-terminal region-domain-containing protein [Blastocladiella britannica]